MNKGTGTRCLSPTFIGSVLSTETDSKCQSLPFPMPTATRTTINRGLALAACHRLSSTAFAAPGTGPAGLSPFCFHFEKKDAFACECPEDASPRLARPSRFDIICKRRGPNPGQAKPRMAASASPCLSMRQWPQGRR